MCFSDFSACPSDSDQPRQVPITNFFILSSEYTHQTMTFPRRNAIFFLRFFKVSRKILFFRGRPVPLAPVAQRPDNFIQWISHYPTVSICAKISVFPLVQVNMHTLTTVTFGSVRNV